MKTIKFISKDKAEFTKALRKNVSNYFKEKNISTKGNWAMAIKAIVLFAFYFGPFILLFTLPVIPWMIFPFAFVMGIAMAGIGMSVMHDAAHGATSKRDWINKFMGKTIHAIGGSAFTWKVQHNIKHHTYTNVTGFDEDIETKAILRLSYHEPLKKIHRFQHIYAFILYIMLSLNKIVADFLQLFRYRREGVITEQKASVRTEMIKMFTYKAIYLFICLGLPMLLTGYSWWLVLFGFLIMHFTAGWILSVVFQLAHVVEDMKYPLPDVNGDIENEWAIHELQTTANFSQKNRILGWYVGGLNFQIEHHLFPNICHVHYPKIAPIVEQTAKEFGIQYTVMPTFSKALSSHARTLKLLGRKMGN